MPNKDKTGPKGQGLKDGHGKGNGKGKSPVSPVLPRRFANDMTTMRINVSVPK